MMVKLPSPIDLLNKTAGLTGLATALDVAYGPAGRERIDIYRPAGAANLPVIVFFYGGSWQWGHRRDYRFFAAILARLGFVVAVPDYRLYPEVKFPDFLTDCAAAAAFMVANAARFGGDPEAVFLAGHSAGAYNAIMLALNAQFLGDQGVATEQIAGAIGLSGPYDFLPLRDRKLIDLFSPPAQARLTQPITYARGDAPPLFLAHGGMDTTVLPRNTTALAARIRKLSGRVETKLYPTLGHIGIILSVLPYLAWRAPVLADMAAFTRTCRARRTSACFDPGVSVVE